jgi:hypothetical protein
MKNNPEGRVIALAVHHAVALAKAGRRKAESGKAGSKD